MEKLQIQFDCGFNCVIASLSDLINPSVEQVLGKEKKKIPRKSREIYCVERICVICGEVIYYGVCNYVAIAGLPQLGYPEVEPIILDELHIALGGGPDGYRAQFKNITARGVSALRITGLRTRITDDEVQLQLAFSIPRIRAAARYRSSGTLILVQASGAGDYWGEYGENTPKKSN